MAVLVAILVFAGFFVARTPVTVHAQTSGVTPTLYCLGGCPTVPVSPQVTNAPSGSTSVAPSGSSSSSSSGSSASSASSGSTSLAPTSAIATTPAPGTSPCPTSSLSSLFGSQATQGNDHHHHDGGFLSGFFQFFLLLIFLLLSQGGLGSGVPCSTTTPSVTPTISGQPSLAPSSTVPSAAPSSTTVQPTSATTPQSTITVNEGGNWSGYVFHPSATAGNTITGAWNEATNVCAQQPKTGDSSPWVGFGGDGSVNDNKIAQLGSDIWCHATPAYDAWTESFPNPVVILSNKVSAGDQFTATVTYTGNGAFTTTMTDTTQGWTVNQPMSFNGYTPKSVEAILEQVGYDDPTNPLPAIQYTPPVTFTNVSAKINGQTVPLQNTPKLVLMEGGDHNIKTFKVSPITQGSFSVTWVHQ